MSHLYSQKSRRFLRIFSCFRLLTVVAFFSLCTTAAYAQLGATLRSTESTCQANGTITVSAVTGGTAPYQAALVAGPSALPSAPYFDLNADGTYSFSALAAGNYTVSLIDDSATGNETRLNITVPGSYSVSNYTPVPSLNACANGTQTGRITVSSITAGRTPFRYRLTKPTTTAFSAVSGTSFVIDNLTPGTTYEVQVWDVCDNFQTRQVQIPAIANPTVPAPNIQYLDCSGNVQATFSASSGTGPYTYSVTAGPNQVGTSNTTGVFNFTTGNYTVRVTDQCGGATNRNVTIGASPAFNLNVSGAASASCSTGTGNTGAIAIAVSGGIKPYQSVVVKNCSGQTITLQPDANGDYNQTLQNLTRPCMFTVVATDKCGTVRTQMFDMSSPGGNTVMGSSQNVSCPVSASTIYRLTMEATLGPPYSPTPPYSYTLLNSSGNPVAGYPLTSNNRTQTVGLPAGEYTFRISDGCGTLSQTRSVTIATYTPPTLTLNTANQCINAGQANLIGVNRNPLNPTFGQYKILSGPNRTGETNTSGVFSNLTSGGNYTFEFNDGCRTVTTQAVMPPYQQPSFEVGFGALCPPITGSSTASLQAFNLNPPTIVRPYTYEIISTGTTNGQTRPAQLDSVFANLTAGFYNIRGFDACNNSFAFVGQVGQLPKPVIQASKGPYCVNQLFRIRVTQPVFGASYTYYRNGQEILSTTAVFAQVPAQSGNYSVLVTAPGGCTSLSDATFTVNLVGTLTVQSPLTACAGGAVDLTAPAVTAGSGSGTFSYFQDAAGTVPLDATTGPATAVRQAGTYYIKLTASASCSNIAPVTVSFAPPLVASLTGTSICAGQSTTLVASGGGQYNFGTGFSTSPFRTVSPTTTTTYSVIVQNNAGCTTTATTTVVVGQLPPVTLSSATICNGQSATLTASVGAGFSGTTYNFGSGSQAENTLVVNPTTLTSYTVVATSGQGCVARATGTVTVNPLPQAALTSATICPGQTVTLTASGGSRYNFGNGPTIVNTYGVSPDATTPYVVTVISAAGCSATATGTVTVNPTPDGSLSSATICRGQSVMLTATGGMLYNFGSGNAATNTRVVSPTATMSYVVTITNGFGCTVVETGSVTVNLLPLPTLSGGVICAGQSATLTATGGTAYTLSDGTTGSLGQFVVSPSATTTYTLTATNALGCVAKASNTVTVNPLPVATLTASSATICEGKSTTLTASGGDVGGPFTYEFGGSISSTGTLVVSPAQTTNYSVVVTSSANCVASATRTVTVNPVPEISIIPANPVICRGSSGTLTANGCTGAVRWSTGETTVSIVITPLVSTTYTLLCTTPQGCTTATESEVTVSVPGAVSINSNSPVCPGDPIFLSASGTGTVYRWAGPNGFTGSAASVSLAAASVADAGVYSVTISGGLCAGIGSTSITVNPAATATLSSASICDGESVTLIATGGTSYEFTGGIMNSTGRLVVSPSQTTAYSVLVTNAQGCVALASGQVTLHPSVTATISSATTCKGNPVVLMLSGGTRYAFNGTTTSNNTITVNPTATTSYSVVVTNAQGCTALVRTAVTVNEPPITAFSSATLCRGETATLAASGGRQYAFSEGTINTTGQLIVSPTATTNYSVLVTDANGCTATTTTTVLVRDLPLTTLTSRTICQGESATLTAGGGTEYDFGTGASTGSQLVVNLQQTTVYSVTAYSSAGCSAATSATVTVNPTPTVGITSIVCQGLATYTVNFTATAGAVVTSNFGTVVGNQVIGIPTTQTVVITATLGACTAVTQATENCQRFAASLGDFVWEDYNGNGQQDAGEPGIGGVQVTLFQNGSVVASQTTSASGVYSFTGLIPGVPYSVSFAAPVGYSATGQNTPGNTTLDSDGNPATGLTTSYTLAPSENNPTIDMGYFRPARLGDQVFIDFDGNGVQGPNDPPLVGVVVSLVVNGSVVASVTTGPDGLYSFTGLTPGVPYVVHFTAPGGFSATTYPTGNTPPTSLTSGEVNLRLDAGFLPLYDLGIRKTVISEGPFLPGRRVTYAIAVTNQSRLPAYNVTVTDQMPQGLTFVSGTDFVVSGANSVSALLPGPVAPNATVTLTLTAEVTPGFSSSLLSNTVTTNDFTSTNIPGGPRGFDTLPDNGTATATIPVLNYASLGNFVWEDTNRDGVQDSNEPGLAGVTVTLYLNGSAIASTTTTAGGLYSFTGLIPGPDNQYVVGFTNPPDTYTATLVNQGGDGALDSDAVGGLTAPVTLTSGENNPTLDAGYYKLRFDLALTKAVVSAPNPLLPGSLVTYLFVVINQGELTAVNTVVTDTPPAGLVFSAGNSPGFTSTGTAQTAVVQSLAPGQSATLTVAYTVMSSNTAPLTNRAEITSDSGDDADSTPGNSATVVDEDDTGTATIQPVQFAALGNFVWEDLNANGQQDSGEPGIEGVVVSLIQNGVSITSTTTNAGGFYSFTGLTPGILYQVQFGQPTGYLSSSANVGGDDTDSDRDPATGLSQSVSMVGGETNPTLDAGFYRPATLGDQVFVDANGDGIQNNNEAPLEGVTITLISNGSVVGTFTTGPDGVYSFTGLTPGVPYSVSFTPPAGYSATTFPTGVSPSVTLASGQVNNTLDAGFELLKPAYKLTKQVSAAKISLGGIVSYTVTLSNSGPVAGTSIVVNDVIDPGITIIPTSPSVSSGTFTFSADGGTWELTSLSAGGTATLTYSASLLAEGVLYNTASLTGGFGVPPSGVPPAQVCTSVPYVVCKDTDYAILFEAPVGYRRYQWLLMEPGSTSTKVVYDGPLESFTATLPGEYSLWVDDGIQGLCPQPSCCSVFIEETEVPSFSAVAQAPTCVGVTPKANGQIRLVELSANAGDLYGYQYTAGTSFTAGVANPLTPTPIPADGVIATDLPSGSYVIRLTDRRTGCTRDLVVVVPPADCACPEDICVPVLIKKTKSLGQPVPE